MGVVFLAKNLGLGGRPEALKAINSQLLENREARARFDREINIVAQLSDHPNIVTAHNVLRWPNLIVLVMEYVDGTDLHKYITKHGPLKIEQACRVIRQVALGLQQAHERNTIHRDIKPANLMVNRQSVVKILDFGLGKAYQEGQSAGLTSTGLTMGTPHFMAPEQLDDATNVDHRADIYSLGCTFFYLLTGKPPFDGSIHAVYKKLAIGAVPPSLIETNPKFPQQLSDIVSKMVAPRANDRFEKVAEVNLALREFASGVPKSAARDSPPQPAESPAPKRSAPTKTQIEGLDECVQPDVVAPTRIQTVIEAIAPTKQMSEETATSTDSNRRTSLDSEIHNDLDTASQSSKPRFFVLHQSLRILTLYVAKWKCGVSKAKLDTPHPRTNSFNCRVNLMR